MIDFIVVSCFIGLFSLMYYFIGFLTKKVYRTNPIITVNGKKYFKTFSEYYVAKHTGVCYVDEVKATYWSHHNGAHSKRHREDGPAIVYDNGGFCWMNDETYHRVDGPAVYCAIRGVTQYYIWGRLLSEEDYWNEPVVKKHLIDKKLKTIHESFND